MAKDCYYLKHDSNARRDPKIVALRHKYGSAGYGNYWILIEELREASGYKIEDKEFVWLSLAEQMKMSVDEARVFVYDLVDVFELLNKEGDFFYSAALIERMAHLDLVREKRRFAGKSRHDNY